MGHTVQGEQLKKWEVVFKTKASVGKSNIIQFVSSQQLLSKDFVKLLYYIPLEIRFKDD